MFIDDKTLKQKLANVYFIWGRGKTTIANRLRELYGCHVYSTDDSRLPHMRAASPEFQPYMCRDFVKEYGVKDFWELPPEVIAEREAHFVAEMTPMIIADLIALAPQHKVILCEGDIDYAAVIPLASHAVHLQNRGTGFDWFDRPDHIGSLDAVKNRGDISQAERDAIIVNAYAAVSGNEGALPDWVVKYGVKNIAWDDSTGIDATALETAEYFGL